MTLHPPFQITSRLMAGLRIGDDSWVQIERSVGTSEGRDGFRYILDAPHGEHEGSDLYSGVGGCDLDEAFGTLLTFLSAYGDRYRYGMQRGEAPDDDPDPLPPEWMEWCYRYSDELGMLASEIEESLESLIEEG